MAIFDLYSKRQKRLRGEIPDVLIYDEIPQPLRVQIVHIIKDAIGRDERYGNEEKFYEILHRAICREYGVFTLKGGYNSSNQQRLLNYLETTQSNDEVMDIVELAFRFIDKVIRDREREEFYYIKSEITPDDAINELNVRFREHGIGYSFSNGEIIRIDSTYLHKEVVIPTLTLLTNKMFAGVNDEYLKAHEHYRHGRNKECLAECLKAFESALKVICQEKGWSSEPTDTARKLIQICFQNNLIPSFTQNQFSSLQSLLESGIPTIRNKLGGHGQGQVPQKVDDEMTRFCLNLTGANIIFLIEQSGLI